MVSKEGRILPHSSIPQFLPSFSSYGGNSERRSVSSHLSDEAGRGHEDCIAPSDTPSSFLLTSLRPCYLPSLICLLTSFMHTIRDGERRCISSHLSDEAGQGHEDCDASFLSPPSIHSSFSSSSHLSHPSLIQANGSKQLKGAA